MNREQITLALTSGRLLEPALSLLSQLGIEPEESPASSRKLVFNTNRKQFQLMILRGVDVLTYVEQGVADIGICGKDVLLEYGGDGYYEPLDLGIGQCRLMVAGPAGPALTPSRMRIATKFVNTTKKYYAGQGIQVDVIRLYGGMELAPLTGLAHRIVDIVDTGNTLKANGLVAMDCIAEISSRLIVNKVSMKMKFDEINAFVESMRALLK